MNELMIHAVPALGKPSILFELMIFLGSEWPKMQYEIVKVNLFKSCKAKHSFETYLNTSILGLHIKY